MGRYRGPEPREVGFFPTIGINNRPAESSTRARVGESRDANQREHKELKSGNVCGTLPIYTREKKRRPRPGGWRMEDTPSSDHGLLSSLKIAEDKTSYLVSWCRIT